MSYFKERFAILKQKSLRLYVLNCFLVNVGSGLGYIASSWMAMHNHTNVFSVGVVMVCFWLPTAFLGPIAGVWADRYSRKTILVTSNALRAVCFVVFGFLLQAHFSEWLLYVFSIINGVLFAINFPAMQKFVRDVAVSDDLLYANSMIDIAYEVGNMLGMALIGVVVMLASAPLALVFNGGFFVLGVVMLMLIPRESLIQHPPQENQQRHLLREFQESLHYLFSRTELWVIYFVQILVFVQVMTATIILAPFVKGVLHASVGQFGDMEAWLSVGLIVGGLLLPYLVRKRHFISILLVVFAVIGISFLMFSYNRSIAIAEVLYFILGVGLACWPIIITQAQQLTNIHFQGRVQSAVNSISSMTILFMFALVSIASHVVSVATMYWIECVFSVAAMVLLWYHRKRF